MPREASPAFQFYPQDFLSDANVMAMSAEERGVYIVLLCHCWIHGFVPKDLKALRRIAGYDGNNWPRTWNSVQHCFRSTPTGFVNPRIERERTKQATYRDMKAKAGQAGGKQTQSRRRAEGQAKSSPPSSSLSLSSSFGTGNKLTSKIKAVLSAQTPPKSKREEDRNVRVITKIAHEVLRSNGHHADSDAVEAIKVLCAKRHIAYDSEAVRKALDSAEAQS